jgi:hypothetical protein
VQLLDLAFTRRLGVEPHASVESSRRVLEKLLQAYIWSGWTSWRCAKSATVACSRTASKAIFAFMPASILRLVFLVTVRSVYHDGTDVFQLSRRS